MVGVDVSGADLRDADLTEVLRAPPPIISVDDQPLHEVLEAHELFCKTDGRDGKVGVLTDVDFRPLKRLKDRRLSGLYAPKAVFFGMDLENAQLQGANLAGADLRGTKLKGADLRGARLMDAQLARADLSGAKLGPLKIGEDRVIRTDLTRAVLRGANLRGVSAQRARFIEADLSSAKLDGADLTGAEMPTGFSGA